MKEQVNEDAIIAKIGFYVRRGQYSQAQKLILNLSKAAKKSSIVCNLQGVLCMVSTQKQETDKAIKYFKQSLQSDAQNLLATSNLIRAYFHKLPDKKIQAKIKSLLMPIHEKILSKMDLYDCILYNNLAYACSQFDQYQKSAENLYKKSLELSEQNSYTLYNYGVFLANKKRYKESEIYAQKLWNKNCESSSYEIYLLKSWIMFGTQNDDGLRYLKGSNSQFQETIPKEIQRKKYFSEIHNNINLLVSELSQLYSHQFSEEINQLTTQIISELMRIIENQNMSQPITNSSKLDSLFSQLKKLSKKDEIFIKRPMEVSLVDSSNKKPMEASSVENSRGNLKMLKVENHEDHSSKRIRHPESRSKSKCPCF